MSGDWPTHAPAEKLPSADAWIEAYAQCYDAIMPMLGDALRNVWAYVRPTPTCDCPLDPHHRWNCALTPIWAQTIRDLDTNPWTVLNVPAPSLRINQFVWDGSRGTYCGLGPCCLGDNHDGRCRM